jgi:predicted sulfurtransferase
MTSELVHLSFYRFYRVGDTTVLLELRMRLQQLCTELQLQGTFLLASEGVNVMMAGSRESIDIFKTFCRKHLGVDEQLFKEASVTSNPFHRLLIKIKKEIISVGDTELRPDEQTGKRISPQALKQWLDEGKPILLVDTRNQYEVQVGTFRGAQELNLDTSRDFAHKAAQHLDQWKQHTVVTFCTGGIRCEKASALLLKLGLEDVYQLDGGILRYFEENGPEHFHGQCFVFDWRLAVDGNLKPVARSSDPDQEFGRHYRSKAGNQ